MLLLVCIHRYYEHPRPVKISQENIEYMTSTWECYLTCNLTCFFKLSQRQLASLTKYYLPNTPCVHAKHLDKDCIEKLEGICKEKPLRAFKTVRTTMESAELMFKRRIIDPEQVRLIHLTREPKASFQSFLNINSDKRSTFLTYNKRVCARLHKDVTIRNHLSQLYPRSIFDLHYEDLAHDPMTVARSAYQFINQTDPPEEVSRWFRHSTNGTGVVERTWDTLRNNSTITADAWKLKMPDDMKQAIEIVCSEFYSITKYYKVTRFKR